MLYMPYLGAVAAVLLGTLIAAISINMSVVRVPVPVISAASSSTPILPVIAPEVIAASSSTQQVVPAAKKAKPSTPESVPIAPAPQKETAGSASAPLPVSEVASLDASAFALRSALVNIICYAPAGSSLRSTSGSGIIVDSKGIILTNAHIAQNFLLEDRGVSCTIRSGSPAIDKYKASLIYIPSEWIDANAKILTETNPSGTGEFDFAFLAISKSATKDELPDSFPSIRMATSPPSTGTQVVIASYGAQFLESIQIQSFLFPTVVFGSVKNVFTFASTSIDVLALGGSVAAQEGSSGGGISDMNRELIGTITTSTTKGTTDTRSLDAITASYIRAEYLRETGHPLDELFSKTISASVADFASKMPALESILTANL